ncbi:MAG: flagellar biosynthesis protein FlhB [Deltaproteobacteria bacterium]|nr:flagellar biosynthesis protein FlhB [Deltaproteobacteria bacterium]
MPAKGDQEKSEQPTARRRQKAREEGQVAKGRELGGVVVLLTSLLFFFLVGQYTFSETAKLWSRLFSSFIKPEMTVISATELLVSVVVSMAKILLPLMMAVFAGAIVANVAQVGFMISGRAVKADLSRLDPIKGFKKIFSLKSLVELVKNLAKLSAVGLVVYLTIKSEIVHAFPLMDEGAWAILAYLMKTSFTIFHRTAWVLLILAIFDYMYQRWEFEQDLKMSKQELKDEYKQTEGDPQIKSRIKALQREMARRRMMEEVPKAAVVITNPTHLAIALRYEKGMRAPVVAAKGAGFIAEQIRKVARHHGVPIVENRAVARILYKVGEIGGEIPTALYKAVAEILAHVFRISKKGLV